MNTQKVRNLLVVALLSLMMVAGNVRPAAAQTFTPVPIGCIFQEKYYPIGTVLHFVLPEPEQHHVYMRCELKMSPWPGGLKPQWVIYGSNPS